MTQTSKIESLIKPLIESRGLKLYDVEFVGRTLRVSIEKTGEEPGGITIEDCVETSRLLNPVLDVEDAVPGGSYELEVSSPGLDRSLRRPEHFEQSIGVKVHVTTKEPLALWNGNDPFYEKRKNVRGEIKEVSQTPHGLAVRLIEESGRDVLIPLDGIQRAYVDFELKASPRPGKFEKGKR